MIRVNVDLILKDGGDEGELAKKLATEKYSKMIADYIDSVVIPDIASNVKPHAVGGWAHVCAYQDSGCRTLYGSDEPYKIYSDA